MKIYMDVCSYNRPFDNQQQDRVYLEAEALSQALTPVGMAYFLRQYETGEGNYTKEREELLKDFTTADIIAGLKTQGTVLCVGKEKMM